MLQTKSFAKHSEAVKFLKEQHGVGHGYANTIVILSKEHSDSPQDLVGKQYQGKENLIPIYKKLIAVVTAFGKDVKVMPKKDSVSIVRKKQFALIKPATKTRIDLGLKLTGKDLSDRLQNSGPFGTMCTHRVQIFTVEEVDAELNTWLSEAYERAN